MRYYRNPESALMILIVTFVGYVIYRIVRGLWTFATE